MNRSDSMTDPTDVNAGPFLFGNATDPHRVGDEDCAECYKGPFPCDCGGLLHYEFGDENWDDYWLYSKCDRCGGDADD